MTKRIQSNAARSVVEALQAEKVEYVFGLAGSHVIHVFNELMDVKEIRHVISKNEVSSTFMAGMYGRLTGRPGVVLNTAGPGATNAITGVAEAYVQSAPMVHIAGNVSRQPQNESFHGVDKADFLHKMFADITKWSVRVERADDIPGVLSQAFSLAVSGRPGPVHVNIPIDIFTEKGVQIQKYQCSPIIKQPPSKELVKLVKEGLINAKNPIICVGSGVLAHRAEKDLVSLAEAISAPVLSSPFAYGAISCEHPLYAGTFNVSEDNPFAWNLMENSDFLLAIGMRSNTPLAGVIGKHSPKNTAFVALDEPCTLGSVTGIDNVYACDNGIFLSEVMGYVNEFKRAVNQDMLSRIKSWQEAYDKGVEIYLKDYENVSPLHFGIVLKELERQLNDDFMVVSGVGLHNIWARLIMPRKKRDSFVVEGSWGTMGSELARGIVAKMIYPDRQVVVVTGDGSLLMNGSDFVTAVEIGANIIVIVLNDSRYGMISKMQKRMVGRTFGDEIGKVDFAKFSECFGGAGIRVEKPEGLTKAVEDVINLSKFKPVILDALCGYEFEKPGIKDLIEMGKR